MARGPKAIALELTDAERAALTNLIRRRNIGQALAQRARIILACAAPGATNLGVAKTLGVSRPTVATWRRRFAAHRLEGLVDVPRPGAPRTIGDEAVERLIALTLEEMPAHATHWSTRAMAKRAGMSQTAVSRIWRAIVRQQTDDPISGGDRASRPGRRPQAAPNRDLQAVLGPGLCRQGA